MKPIVSLLLILYSMSVVADDMRCGNRLVHAGDDMARVLLVCGAPDDVEKSLRGETPQEGKRGAVRQMPQAVEVERWSYFSGSGSLGKVLIFEEGRLNAIEVDQRR